MHLHVKSTRRHQRVRPIPLHLHIYRYVFWKLCVLERLLLYHASSFTSPPCTGNGFPSEGEAQWALAVWRREGHKDWPSPGSCCSGNGVARRAVFYNYTVYYVNAGILCCGCIRMVWVCFVLLYCKFAEFVCSHLVHTCFLFCMCYVYSLQMFVVCDSYVLVWCVSVHACA